MQDSKQIEKISFHYLLAPRLEWLLTGEFPQIPYLCYGRFLRLAKNGKMAPY